MPTLEPPNDFHSHALAEWLEITMALEERTEISRSEIRARWAAGQEPDQAELDELFAEIGRRAEVGGYLYPFRPANKDVIEWGSAAAPPVYMFLALLSMVPAPFRRNSRFNEVSPALEWITARALKVQLGPGSSAVSFGWPSSDGRPKRLDEAAGWLADRMGVSLGAVDADVDADDKDGGVDVVAWRGFKDEKGSFLVILCQCTVQETYERKPGDIVPETWIQWVRFGRFPVIALSIPFIVPIDAKVRIRLRDRASLLLDRLRICELLQHDESVRDAAEMSCLSNWVSSEIERVRLDLTSPTAAPGIARRKKPRRGD